ncbi:MAG TPA: DUF255 domain-containing protein [Saprospiraceae bacterium]|nr:DUF255 domain-containing protein [Saprospiraceae bacterium]
MNLLKIFAFLLLPVLGFSQSKVHWLTMEEAIAKSKVEKRKIFIDVYTHWCGWCKKMEKSTFQTDEVAKILNEDYYPVKLDAEQKAPITFNGRVFQYVKSGRGGYHELAAYFLDSQMSYPTVVFLDENLNIIQAIPGYRDKKEFALMANYFGKNFHKRMSWAAYSKKYK